MKTRLLSAAAIAAFTLGATHAAWAQTVDYGSLEALFDEPVTTSATGSPQRSIDAPADMQIISADDIRRSGEITLPGILQRAAGIDVIDFSVGDSTVNIRGHNPSPGLLVLINGRQVYQDTFGTTTWPTLPVQLSEIRQIEVVKGPNAALFGFNAVSGVINIITYDPKYDAINAASVQVGDAAQRRASLVTTLKLGPAVSVRLSGGGSAEHEWRAIFPTSQSSPVVPAPAIGGLHDPTRGQANLDLVAQLTSKSDLRFESSWSNIQGNVAAPYSYSTVKMLTTSVRGIMTSDTRYGLIQASAYQNRLDIKGDAGSVFWENTVDVANVQDTFKAGTGNIFRISGDYRHNHLNTQPVAGGEISYNVWSASGMWNRRVTSQLALTAAIRVDDLQLHRSGTFPARIPLASNSYWDHDIVQPSVNVTGLWRPTAEDSFRLSYARGVQTPTLLEMGALQEAVELAPGVTLNVTGNPNLRPTIVVNYEAAYDRQFKQAKLGLRLFVQNWSDIIGDFSGGGGLVLPPTATTNLAVIPANVSNSEETGVELTASGRLLANLKWRADYTYSTVRDSLFGAADPVANLVAFQAITPKYRGNVGLGWARGPWEADANLHYVGAHKFYNVVNGALAPVDAYGSLSARIGYRLESGVVLALSGQNLLAERQAQTTGLKAERRWQFTMSRAW
ncbi:MAG TPA: TonB-dependent receptor [Caulobacteraceae bacterium]|nr:TonB-dependent receptor [Caulobacteraceae bacterium]